MSLTLNRISAGSLWTISLLLKELSYTARLGLLCAPCVQKVNSIRTPLKEQRKLSLTYESSEIDASMSDHKDFLVSRRNSLENLCFLLFFKNKMLPTPVDVTRAQMQISANSREFTNPHWSNAHWQSWNELRLMEGKATVCFNIIDKWLWFVISPLVLGFTTNSFTNGPGSDL